MPAPPDSWTAKDGAVSQSLAMTRLPWDLLHAWWKGQKPSAPHAPGAPTADDSHAAPAAPSVADQIRELAQKASAALGLDPQLIFDQWQHETGGFTNRGARELNNLAGIRQAGRREYRSFESLDAFEDFYVKLLGSKRYTDQGLLSSRSIEEFAQALKQGGYFEDKLGNYIAGMKRFDAESVFGGASAAGGRGAQAADGPAEVHFGDIHIQLAPQNMTPEQLYRETVRAFTDTLEREISSNIAQLGYAGG